MGDILVLWFLFLCQLISHNSTLCLLLYQLLEALLLCKIDMDFAMEKPTNILT